MSFEGDNMMGLKRNNRRAALKLLHEEGSMSRKRMAEHLSLTPAAISKIVGEMLSEGLLHEGNAIQSGSVGRREIMVELNNRCGYGLGILINLRQAILSAAWLDSTVIFSEEVTLTDHAPTEETVQLLSKRMLELLAEHNLSRERAVGLGIAVRGICSVDGRNITDSFGALEEGKFPLCQRFEELTGFSAVMMNNVKALFSAHMFLEKETNEGAQFFLRSEFGIGAALSVKGDIWHGVTEQCAEIGHIPVVSRGGKPCSCGKSGCLETIASPTAIREDALAILSPDKTPILWNISRKKGAEALDIDDIMEAALSGDEGIGRLVDRAVKVLADALKSVIYLFDPDKIVLYGRMFDNPYYLSRLLGEMSQGVDTRHALTIEKSRYNHRLEEKAACLLAVNAFFDRGGVR